MKIARYDSLTRPLVEMLGISTIIVALAGRGLAGHQAAKLICSASA